MNITILETDADSSFVYVRREIKNHPLHPDETHINVERMPIWTQACRAAEYDLDPEDPTVMDLVMLEHYYSLTTDTPGTLVEQPPLFTEDSISGALSVMRKRLVVIRKLVKAPTDAAHSRLWNAADTDEATKGLVDLKKVKKSVSTKLHKDIAGEVKESRDRIRRIALEQANAAPRGIGPLHGHTIPDGTRLGTARLTSELES